MFHLTKKLWLAWSKLRFLLTPEERRVRLEIETDGRHLTYILASLHFMGYGVQIMGGEMLFRELLCLRKSLRIPFIFGGRPLKFGFLISDRKEAIRKARAEGASTLFLDYDFFDEERRDARMPYFMHPSIYHAGLHLRQLPDSQKERPVRIGFFGTRNAAFYTENFHFPILNREQILEVLFGCYGEEIKFANSPVSAWKRQQIIVSLDQRGGDNSEKKFIPRGEYLKALGACDFFLSPPGCVMPTSHSLVEGMACGSIPIINCGDFLYPRLEHGVNCLSFTTKQELHIALKTALEMPCEQVTWMRGHVIRYYEEYLKPGRWMKKILGNNDLTVLVNAEEVSVSLRVSGKY